MYLGYYGESDLLKKKLKQIENADYKTVKESYLAAKNDYKNKVEEVENLYANTLRTINMYPQS